MRMRPKHLSRDWPAVNFQKCHFIFLFSFSLQLGLPSFIKLLSILFIGYSDSDILRNSKKFQTPPAHEA